jgi:hypothetical protein
MKVLLDDMPCEVDATTVGEALDAASASSKPMPARAAGGVSARSTSKFARLHEARVRYGWRGVVQRLPAKAAGQPRRLWRRIARHRNHVFVHEGFTAKVSEPPGLTVIRCTTQAEIPENVLAAMLARGGAAAQETALWELEHHAVQWTGLIDGEFVGTCMSRRGRHFAKWFVPLEGQDIVIFRNWTLPEHRGKGICPSIMRRIIAQELANGGKAHTDCRVYNKPSIRSIEKVGFRRIVTKRPLERSEAIK